MKSIAVFCGSSDGKGDKYIKAARALGLEMVKRNLSLVYGGGNRGIMGIVAHAVYDNGGHVTGVLPKAMNVPSVTNDTAESESIITSDMHERKKTMYALSDAFIALPGGIGTVEEIAEVYTWRQLGYHHKNIGLLNVDGFWDPILEYLQKSVEEGFVAPQVRDILIVSDNVEELLDKLAQKPQELPDKLK